MILSAPTRFVRDWIVSRYVDQLLDKIKNFKPSIQRIEFSIDEQNDNFSKKDYKKNNRVSLIENSV